MRIINLIGVDFIMNSKIEASVVIPTRNRREILKKNLKALNKQSYNYDEFEIIVVDDGSTKNNKTMIENLNLKPKFKYYYQKQSGPANARNKGIKNAQGDYIIFIDDDIIVNEKFIENHLKKHKENKKVIVHGPVIYTNNLDNPTSAEKKISDFSNAFFATGNASIKKEYLLKAGLFNEKFKEYGWEDLELGTRLKKMDLSAVHAEDAVGYHLKYKFTPDHIPAVKNRERQRGRMAVLYHEINPSFSVKMSTLYWKPFLILIELLTLGNWPNTEFTKKLISFFDDKDLSILRNILLYFVKLDSYLKGLKEGYK